MCFGGGSMSFSKPDYGPLPSLRDDETEGLDPVYKNVRTGQQQRGMLTSQNRSLLMRVGRNVSGK